MHTFSTLPLTSPESSSGLLQSEISEALDVGAMTVVQKHTDKPSHSVPRQLCLFSGLCMGGKRSVFHPRMKVLTLLTYFEKCWPKKQRQDIGSTH